MNYLQTIKQNYSLILGLGTLALIRPIMKITGLIAIFNNDLIGTVFITLLITFAWIIIAVKKDVQEPIEVLVSTSITYAILAIILSSILSPILLGRLYGPLTNPFAIFSMLVTNMIWGFIAGVIAFFILKVKENLLDKTDTSK